ncbi:MAG: transcriptional regulator PpsR [Pseudomonadota bacterium]
MDKSVVRDVPQKLSRELEVFSGLDTRAFADLLGAAADAVLLLSKDGIVLDLAASNAEFGAIGLADWVGKPLMEAVTSESRVKIEGLLSDAATRAHTEARQVNHPMDPERVVEMGIGSALPVVWRLVTLPGLEGHIALGTSIADTARTQQRLVTAQLELESEYRILSNQETRFRAAFHSTDIPLMILDRHGCIEEANGAAAKLFGRNASKLAGATAQSLLEAQDGAAIASAISATSTGQPTNSTKVSLPHTDQEISFSLSPFREQGAVHLVATLNISTNDNDQPSATSVHVTDVLPEAVVTTDRDGVIRQVNERFLDLAQLTASTGAHGRNLSGWLGTSNVDMSVLLTQLSDDGVVRRFSTTLRTELGSSLNVLVSAALSATNGNDAQSVHFVILEARGTDSRLIVEPGSAMSPQSDFAQLVGRVPLKELVRDASDAIEKMCIEAALRQTGNNRASAADILGVSRQSLYIKLRRHGLESFKG